MGAWEEFYRKDRGVEKFSKIILKYRIGKSLKCHLIFHFTAKERGSTQFCGALNQL